MGAARWYRGSSGIRALTGVTAALPSSCGGSSTFRLPVAAPAHEAAYGRACYYWLCWCPLEEDCRCALPQTGSKAHHGESTVLRHWHQCSPAGRCPTTSLSTHSHALCGACYTVRFLRTCTAALMAYFSGSLSAPVDMSSLWLITRSGRLSTHSTPLAEDSRLSRKGESAAACTHARQTKPIASSPVTAAQTFVSARRRRARARAAPLAAAVAAAVL